MVSKLPLKFERIDRFYSIKAHSNRLNESFKMSFYWAKSVEPFSFYANFSSKIFEFFKILKSFGIFFGLLLMIESRNFAEILLYTSRLNPENFGFLSLCLDFILHCWSYTPFTLSQENVVKLIFDAAMCSQSKSGLTTW